MLDFYPRFGFRRVQESVFELEVEPAATPAPRLDLDDPPFMLPMLAQP